MIYNHRYYICYTYIVAMSNRIDDSTQMIPMINSKASAVDTTTFGTVNTFRYLVPVKTKLLVQTMRLMMAVILHPVSSRAHPKQHAISDLKRKLEVNSKECRTLNAVSAVM